MKKLLFSMIVISNVFPLLHSMDRDPSESSRAAREEVIITDQDSQAQVIKKIKDWLIHVETVRLTTKVKIKLQDLVGFGLLSPIFLGDEDEVRQYIFDCIVQEKYTELQRVVDILNNLKINTQVGRIVNDALVLAAMKFSMSVNNIHVKAYAESLNETTWKWAIYFIKGLIDSDDGFVKNRREIINVYKGLIDGEKSPTSSGIRLHIIVAPWATKCLTINFRQLEYIGVPKKNIEHVERTARYILPLLIPALERLCVDQTGIYLPDFSVYALWSYILLPLPSTSLLTELTMNQGWCGNCHYEDYFAVMGLTKSDRTVDVSKIQKFIKELENRVEIEKEHE